MRKKQYGLWHDISWNTYNRLARYVGAALISMGLEKQDTVSIIGDNCPEWIIINMGVQFAGAVTTGIYATNAWPQVAYVNQNSEAKFFFVENEEQLDKWLQFKETVPHLKKVIVWDLKGLREFKDTMVITYDELLEVGRVEIEKSPDILEQRLNTIQADDICMLIYTSGTTGPSKGSVMPHNYALWTEFDGNDVWVGTSKGLARAVGEGYYPRLRKVEETRPSLNPACANLGLRFTQRLT